MTDIILHNGVRIFRPVELKSLITAIDKQQNSIAFYTLLLTGSRYIELGRFQSHPEWFDYNYGFIHLPRSAQKKKKLTQPERWIRLNPLGKTYVDFFLKLNGYKLPSRQSWDQNLKRWAKSAGLDPTGCCAKSTRKTCESWLVYLYPEHLTKIILSQGHDELTSLRHYQMMPFIEQEKVQMLEFFGGWI